MMHTSNTRTLVAMSAEKLTTLSAMLRDVRTHLADDLQSNLECCCLLNPDLSPRRDTLDEIDRPHIERLESLIARVNEALAEVEIRP